MDRVWKTYLYGFLKDSYTGFSICFRFWDPKFKFSIFQKSMAMELKNEVIEEMDNILLTSIPPTRTQNFKAISLLFVMHCSKNQVPVLMSIFKDAFVNF